MKPAEAREIEAQWVDVRTLNNIELFTQFINVGQLAKCGYPAAVIRLHALNAERLRRAEGKS
jgi:hypothetical protein